jgi:flagellar export protein FliJ
VKRFQFSLERVLKLKEQRERLAELRLKQAHAALEQARAVVVALRTELARTAAALEGKLGQTIAPGAWMVHYQHSTYLGQAIDLAEGNVARAAQAVREAAAERTRIATEVEAMLHLRHGQWQEHWDETMRQEQIRLDDLGMRRWATAPTTDESAAGREGETG